MRIKKPIERSCCGIFFSLSLGVRPASHPSWGENPPINLFSIHPQFSYLRTGALVACHTGLKPGSGLKISLSIGLPVERQPSWPLLARTPYLAGQCTGRESIDHPASQASIEMSAPTCHNCRATPLRKPGVDGHMTRSSSHLPLKTTDKGDSSPSRRGFTCSVVFPPDLRRPLWARRRRFNGEVDLRQPAKLRPATREYGPPFERWPGHKRVMPISTAGFVSHARRSNSRCGSLWQAANTLSITDAFGDRT